MINELDDVPVLLRNVSPDKNHWVGLKLIGGPNSPRAAVFLTAGGILQRSDVLSGGSFS
jgi:enediyne biosynthesis protein E4